MKRHFIFLAAAALLFSAGFPAPAAADSSHARIIRLSLVQGDVRFTRDFHDDSLNDSQAVWETAALNLPIRQGYALSTDSGRAEVEFENGAMAFLGANTIVEFYDLSLRDGHKTTRLVLRQGTAIFYVNPASGDYFSVTGGDFTVEANHRAKFRMDNFDDGSQVSVEQGQANVLRDEQSTPLEKGQSLSLRAGDAGKFDLGRALESDDFDRWVSGRIESVVTATNYSNQYANSPGYTSGFADLYTYGSWLSVGGYGYGWRPFGAGFGWSPFGYGGWFFDAGMGWSFIGSAPWGWLPYHYGSWVFSPVYGWVWIPTGFGVGRPVIYRPATAVWVRSGSTVGLVPLHPADTRGKTPLNIAQGVYAVEGRGLAATTTPSGEQNWSVVKGVPRDTFAAGLATTSSPTRVPRIIAAGNGAGHPLTSHRDSSIVYDPSEHRFVNANIPLANTIGAKKTELGAPVKGNVAAANTATMGTVAAPATPPPSRTVVVPRPAVTPPPPHSTTGSSTRSSSASGAVWGRSGNSASSTGSSHPSSSSSSHPSGGSGKPH